MCKHWRIFTIEYNSHTINVLRHCSWMMNKMYNMRQLLEYVKAHCTAVMRQWLVYIMYVRGSNFVYSLIFMRFYTAHTRRNSPGVGYANLYFSWPA